MNRRRLIAAGGLATFGLLSGCGLERLSTSRPMQQRRLACYSNNLASDPDVSGLMDVFRDAMLDRGYAEDRTSSSSIDMPVEMGRRLSSQRALSGSSLRSLWCRQPPWLALSIPSPRLSR